MVEHWSFQVAHFIVVSFIKTRSNLGLGTENPHYLNIVTYYVLMCNSLLTLTY